MQTGDKPLVVTHNPRWRTEVIMAVPIGEPPPVSLQDAVEGLRRHFRGILATMGGACPLNMAELHRHRFSLLDELNFSFPAQRTILPLVQATTAPMPPPTQPYSYTNSSLSVSPVSPTFHSTWHAPSGQRYPVPQPAQKTTVQRRTTSDCSPGAGQMNEWLPGKAFGQEAASGEREEEPIVIDDQSADEEPLESLELNEVLYSSDGQYEDDDDDEDYEESSRPNRRSAASSTRPRRSRRASSSRRSARKRTPVPNDDTDSDDELLSMPPQEEEQMDVDFDVIIVGAGPAGMAAADELKGRCQFVVLEARSTPGGRVRPLPGPVTGFSAGPPARSWDELMGCCLLRKGLKARYGSLLEDWKGTIEETIRRLAMEDDLSEVDIFQAAMDGDALPGQFLSKRVQDVTLIEVLDTFSATNRSHPDKDALETALLLFVADAAASGVPVETAGLQAWVERKKCDYFHLGIPTVPSAEGLDVRCKRQVCKVRYFSNYAQVCLDDGTKLTARRLIMAVPLPVISSQIQFEPPLPSWKLDGIERIGFSTVNWVVIEFEEAFWKKIAVPLDGDFWPLIAIIDLHELSSQPALLVLTREHAPPEEAANSILEYLGKSWDLPPAVRVAGTEWRSDLLAGGAAFSHLKPAAGPSYRDIVAAPVQNVVYFAGEYADGRNPSTVAGAVRSGTTQAQKALCSLIVGV